MKFRIDSRSSGGGTLLLIHRAIGIPFSCSTADASVKPTSLPHLVSMTSDNANSCALSIHSLGNDKGLCKTRQHPRQILTALLPQILTLQTLLVPISSRNLSVTNVSHIIRQDQGQPALYLSHQIQGQWHKPTQPL
jgi:hypothetical protein